MPNGQTSLVRAFSHEIQRHMAQTHRSAPSARYYYGTWVGAEASDANLSIVQLTTGTRARFVPKLAQVTGLVSGDSVVLVAQPPIPMHIVGKIVGNIYVAQVPPSDGTAPTVPGTPTVSAHSTTSLTVAWTPASDANGIAGYDVLINGTYNQSVIGTTATIPGLVPATSYQITVRAHDTTGMVGPPSGVLTASTDTPAAPGPTTQTKSYFATWSRTFNYNNNNEYDPQFGSTIYQGKLKGSGHHKSMIGFDSATIQNDLAGSTSVSASIRLTFARWYLTSGGTAIIGTHGVSTPPSVFSGSTNQYQSANWHSGETRTVPLDPKVVDSFRSGSVKGITVGPGLADKALYYGYAYGYGSAAIYLPMLTLTYVK